MFLVMKSITSAFDLLFFSVSQRVQRTRVQMFYLLTRRVEKLVRDVNVYGRRAESTTTLLFRSLLVVKLTPERRGWGCEVTAWWHRLTSAQDTSQSPLNLRLFLCLRPSDLQQSRTTFPTHLGMKSYFILSWLKLICRETQSVTLNAKQTRLIEHNKVQTWFSVVTARRRLVATLGTARWKHLQVEIELSLTLEWKQAVISLNKYFNSCFRSVINSCFLHLMLQEKMFIF